MAHRAALVDYAASILGCRAWAEDVVQEAYLRFSCAESEEGDVIRPAGYLYRIVRNLALDGRRSQGADLRRIDAHHVLTAVAVSAPSPEDRVLYRDSLRHADEALAALPDPMARAFRLHRLDGWTLQRIADTLGISVATAHRFVRAGHAAVTQRLVDDCDGLGRG